MNRLLKIFAALSQVINAIIGGHNNETLSGRAWRKQNKFWIKFFNAIFFWQKNHCLTSHLEDVIWAYDFIHKLK